MADTYDIVYYGDKRLTAKNEKVKEIDNNIRKIAQKMIRTMKEKEGIGLAGPQVGINKKIVVIDLSFGQKENSRFMVLINPEIVEYGEEKDVMEEGCLSFPELFIEVERSKEVKIKANPSNIKYLKEKGYNPVYGEELIVKVIDLKESSNTNIEVECDICKTKLQMTYKQYNQY